MGQFYLPLFAKDAASNLDVPVQAPQQKWIHFSESKYECVTIDTEYLVNITDFATIAFRVPVRAGVWSVVLSLISIPDVYEQDNYTDKPSWTGLRVNQIGDHWAVEEGPGVKLKDLDHNEEYNCTDSHTTINGNTLRGGLSLHHTWMGTFEVSAKKDSHLLVSLPVVRKTPVYHYIRPYRDYAWRQSFPAVVFVSFDDNSPLNHMRISGGLFSPGVLMPANLYGKCGFSRLSLEEPRSSHGSDDGDSGSDCAKENAYLNNPVKENTVIPLWETSPDRERPQTSGADWRALRELSPQEVAERENLRFNFDPLPLKLDADKENVDPRAIAAVAQDQGLQMGLDSASRSELKEQLFRETYELKQSDPLPPNLGANPTSSRPSKKGNPWKKLNW
ncbi:CP readthrough protein [Grapevine polerovirus 1]|nr:CP readthrough protein [Grapevine polerovirus 1]